jgi:hypothetical protein
MYPSIIQLIAIGAVRMRAHIAFRDQLTNISGSALERTSKARLSPRSMRRICCAPEFMKRSWKGQTIVFSFTSDPYVPLEANYQLTRKCLEVCLEFRNPVGIVTKSALIRRDVELIAALSRESEAMVFFHNSLCRPRLSACSGAAGALP